MSTRFRAFFVLTVTLLFGAAGFAPAGAQGSRSAPLVPAPPTAALSAAVEEPPVRIAAGFGVEPLADLVVAEEGAADAVRAIAEWNRADRVPMRNGIVRAVPSARAVRFDASVTNAPAGLHAGGAFARVGSGSTVWGASVRVANAHRLRLHLADFDLPAGTRMWVYGDDGETVAFSPELAFEGELWTPSVGGETIRLEVELPADAFERSTAAADRGFTVDRVGQTFRLDATGAPILDPYAVPKAAGDCLIDVSCVSPSTFPKVDDASRAIAHYQFPFGPFLAICSGGVLNLAQEAPNDLDPPFLTANHCVSTPSEAAGVEAFWDFRTSVCGGEEPNLATLPRTNGSQLLVTSGDSDFTLLGMSLPAGRALLGWNAEVPVQPGGTILHRISHPAPFNDALSQQYTRYQVKEEILTCATLPGDPAVNDLEVFHHTVFEAGGTYGGSSGAPLMLANGQVVGQLFGACGPNVEDGCSILNDELDGNFYTSFDLAAPFLGAAVDPGDGWLSTPELPGYEFQVNITPAGGATVQGRAEANCIVETFCASGALAGRPEVFVKVIGPRPNGFLWVQISRFTPSEVEVMVRQSSTGLVQEYTLPPVGALSDDVSGLQDREAFVP